MSPPTIFILFCLAFVPGLEPSKISETDWTEVTSFSKFYHYRGPTKYEFADAKSYCESKGGILWQPYSREEEAFIKAATSARHIWIGVIRTSGTGSFYWITRCDTNYSNWGEDHPITGKTNAFSENMKWWSRSSNDTNFVVCELQITTKSSTDLSTIKSMLSIMSTRLNDLETKTTTFDTRIASLSNGIDKITALLEEQQCSAEIEFEPVE